MTVDGPRETTGMDDYDFGLPVQVDSNEEDIMDLGEFTDMVEKRGTAGR